MTTPNLGETPNDSGRDAVHIPVIAMTAAERLLPGAEVRLIPLEMNEEEAFYYRGPGAEAHAAQGRGDGIVDPYLTAPVEKGGTFWMFMREIDGQPRHDWNHPKLRSTYNIASEAGAADAQCCYGGG